MSNQNMDTDKSKPEDTDFRQQRLRSWQPLLTPRWVIIMFFLIGLIFIPIGVVLLTASEDITEINVRYDNVPCTDSTLDSNTVTCDKDVHISIDRDMKGPVFLYYKLTNFYQNHRRYVQSRSDVQLAGENGSTSTCSPLENFNGKQLYPCGLVANSVFSDTFVATANYQNGNSEVLAGKKWDKSNIAWSSDMKTKFKDLYSPTTATPLPDGLTRDGPNGPMPTLNDPELMVWMRPAGTSSFRKLHRKIDGSFHKGDKITIRVTDQFKVSQFDGTKTLVLSTIGWAGGKNYFLSWAYIVTGVIATLFAIFFALKQIIAPRPLGELKAYN